MGANVFGVDIGDDKLDMAKQLGATEVINSSKVPNLVEAVKELTTGGTHVSIDALGYQETYFNSVANLRKRGKHIQIGLMPGDHITPQVPMGQVIANELEYTVAMGYKPTDMMQCGTCSNMEKSTQNYW
jgi:alcohol dehydrogenase